MRKRLLLPIALAVSALFGFQSAAAPRQGNVLTPNKPNSPWHKQVHKTKIMKTKANRQAKARMKKTSKQAKAMNNTKAHKEAQARMKKAAKRAKKAQKTKNTGGHFLSPITWQKRAN